MPKKRLFLLFFLIWYSERSYSANYYLSASSGNDERTLKEAQHPDTPWQSLNRLNDYIPQLNPGDSVLFKSGDVFYGSLNLKKSGTSEKPIVFSHYGEGAPPVISGFSTLKNWEKSAPGIYFTHVPQTTPQINVLTLNGLPQPLGRFPNRDEKNMGYLIPDEITVKNQISHETLNESGQWAGAELVIRKNHWIIDREKVLSHQNNSLTFLPSSGYPPKKGYGFFVQNHLNTLDQMGEWYHDVQKNRLYLCTGEQTPEELRIKVSIQEHLLTTLTNTRHILIKGIHFEGANKDALLIRGGTDFHLDAVAIENSGENAIMVQNMDRFRIENSKILNAQNSGIYLRSGNYQASIRKNHIENTHIYSGMGQSGDNNGYGIFSISDADTITNNTIKNSGYVGIGFRGSNTLVKNNYIDGFCLVKGDGGGIYSYTGNAGKKYSNRKIIGNIIQNGNGAREGTPLHNTDFPAPAEGIYLDDNTENILVADNTVSQINNRGIYLHNAKNINVRNNLVFDASFLIFLADDQLGQPLAGVLITENTLIKKNPHQVSMGVRSANPEFTLIGVSDQNKHVDISGAGASFSIQNNDTKEEIYFSLEGWRKKTNWENKSEETIQSPEKPYSYTSEGKTIKNIGFSTDTSGLNCVKDCTLTWGEGGYVSVSAENEVSGLKLDIGPVRHEQIYLLTLTASSSEPVMMEAYLRQRGPAYQKLCHGKPFALNKNGKENQILIQQPREDGDASLILNIFQSKNEIRIDNIRIDMLPPMKKTDEPDSFLLVTNPKSSQDMLDLKGSYKDLASKRHSGKINLAPYQSIFLIKE